MSPMDNCLGIFKIMHKDCSFIDAIHHLKECGDFANFFTAVSMIKDGIKIDEAESFAELVEIFAWRYDKCAISHLCKSILKESLLEHEVKSLKKEITVEIDKQRLREYVEYCKHATDGFRVCR